jgi:hypothetical protein
MTSRFAENPTTEMAVNFAEKTPKMAAFMSISTQNPAIARRVLRRFQRPYEHRAIR